MTWPEVILALLAATALGVLAWRWHSPHHAPNRITPAARRILFPFLGETISPSTLDAALRLARAEGATLVPAYLVLVPRSLSLNAAAPSECEHAMPLLEAIEQRAGRLGVAVDSRIETGRTPRHAVRQLMEHERFDRLIVPAAGRKSDGFAADDVAWLLDHVPGEIVVVRPGANGAKRSESPSVAA
jgi:hypothetical protein